MLNELDEKGFLTSAWESSSEWFASCWREEEVCASCCRRGGEEGKRPGEKVED
jgi:hypothetical protein